MVYIGAKTWEAEKKKAQEEAKRIEEELKRKKISEQEALKRIENLQSGSKYNRVDVGHITEKSGEKVKDLVSDTVARQRASQSYITPAPQFHDSDPSKGYMTENTNINAIKNRLIDLQRATPNKKKKKEYQEKINKINMIKKEAKKHNITTRDINQIVKELNIISEKKAKEDIEKPEKVQSSDPNSFPASEKFIKLYEERKGEIERLRKEEAGNKAWEEWVKEIKKKRAEERKPIQRAKEIISQKPSLKKFKEFYGLWFTDPDTFEIARAELRHEAILRGDKGSEYLLSAMKPFSYVRQHPIKTAVVIGAVSTPVLAVASKVPVLGSVVSSKVFSYGLLATYGGFKGYDITTRVIENKLDYKRASSIVELGSEPVLEIGAFQVGAIASKKAIGLASHGLLKLKEYQLSKQVKGKTPQEVKNILKQKGLYNGLQLENQPVKKMETKAVTKTGDKLSTNVRTGDKSLIKPTKGDNRVTVRTNMIDTKIRVKELRGYEATRETKIKGGKLKSKGVYKPVYSKSYLVEPSQLKQPDYMVLETVTVRKGIAKGPKIKSKGNELNLYGGYESSYTANYRVSIKDLPKLSDKVILKSDLRTSAKGEAVERAVSLGKFRSANYDSFSTGNIRVTNQQPQLEKFGNIMLDGKATPKQVSYTYQIDTKDIITHYKPVITETGEALGSIKYTFLKSEGWVPPMQEFLTSGRGKPATTPSNRFTSAVKSNEIQVSEGGGSGQVTIQVVEGVKLTRPTQTTKTETIFHPVSESKTEGAKSKSKAQTQETETKYQSETEEFFKVRETVVSDLSKGKFDKLKDVILDSNSISGLSIIQKPKQEINKLSVQEPQIDNISARKVIPISKVDTSQDITPDQVKVSLTDSDITTTTDQTSKLKTINIKTRPHDYDIPRPKDPPKKNPFLTDLDGERGRGGIYEVQVRKKGVFRKLGIFKTPREAFVKGKGAVMSSASASFKVIPLRGTEDLSKVSSSVLSRRIFRKSRKEPNVFVQKRQFRISSGGEKKDITFKGLLTQRLERKRRRNIFNIFGG